MSDEQQWKCVHIVPDGERDEHWTAEIFPNCLCAPEVLERRAGVLELGIYIIHHAFDGRESVNKAVML